MGLFICGKIQKQVENIIYERGACKTLHKKFFSSYGNLIRECFNEKNLAMWKFCKNNFQKANK